MDSIWLFKSESESNNAYEDILKKNNLLCETVPTLTFNYINQNSLKDALLKPNNFSGIIFTSMRAVQSLENVYSNLTFSVHQEWNHKKIFAIGKATGEAVKAKLNLESVGWEAGNAKQLAPIIIDKTQPFDKPLLYPCGNLKRDELPTLLAQNDRDFRAINSYETKEHPQLESSLSKLWVSQKPSFIVFFSPSGVQFAIPLFNKYNYDLTGIKVIAIGPTTNSALVSKNILVSGICPEPSPEGLIQILKAI